MKGKKTCNNISMMDYFLLSSPVFSLMKVVDVLDFSPIFSDVYCGLCFSLHASVNNFTTHSFDNCSTSSAHAKWVHNKENLFINTVSSDVHNTENLFVNTVISDVHNKENLFANTVSSDVEKFDEL